MTNCNNNRIEEYRTLRKEILEIYNRKNRLINYAVLATATIFGYAMLHPSPHIFLLPLIIIIPLSYNTLALERGIVGIATYISDEIESKLEGLQWETSRKEKRGQQIVGRCTFLRKLKRQAVNYLLFDLLAILCLFFSFSQVLAGGIDAFYLFSGFNLSTFLDFLKENTLLVVLWSIVIFYLVCWTIKMTNCWSPKDSSYQEEEINNVIKNEEEITK